MTCGQTAVPHRTTVRRRLARADELLPRSLAEDPLGGAAARQARDRALTWTLRQVPAPG
jgi:hypothetical protein